jgi:hypothetical protein
LPYCRFQEDQDSNPPQQTVVVPTLTEARSRPRRRIPSDDAVLVYGRKIGRNNRLTRDRYKDTAFVGVVKTEVGDSCMERQHTL